jgi:hypothetical protein
MLQAMRAVPTEIGTIFASVFHSVVMAGASLFLVDTWLNDACRR